MKNILAAAVAIAVLSMGSAALAEPREGPGLGNNVDTAGIQSKKRDAAMAAHEVARCLYYRRNGPATGLVDADGSGLAEASYKALMGSRSCFELKLSNELVGARMVTYEPDLLRGSIAEVALSTMQRQAAQLQPLPLQQKRYARPWFAATARNLAVDEMAVCIADTNPTGIMTLLGTEPETRAEATAFGALGDSLRKCLVVGAKLQASRQALRAALADALYQRLRNPALSVQGEQTAQK